LRAGGRNGRCQKRIDPSRLVFICDAIGPILDIVTSDECANYFAKAGYAQT
jgi:hypothetical protein